MKKMKSGCTCVHCTYEGFCTIRPEKSDCEKWEEFCDEECCPYPKIEPDDFVIRDNFRRKVYHEYHRHSLEEYGIMNKGEDED